MAAFTVYCILLFEFRHERKLPPRIFFLFFFFLLFKCTYIYGESQKSGTSLNAFEFYNLEMLHKIYNVIHCITSLAKRKQMQVMQEIAGNILHAGTANTSGVFYIKIRVYCGTFMTPCILESDRSGVLNNWPSSHTMRKICQYYWVSPSHFLCKLQVFFCIILKVIKEKMHLVNKLIASCNFENSHRH